MRQAKVFLVVCALGVAAGCSPDMVGARGAETETEGALRGQLVRWTMSRFDGTTSVAYRLRIGGDPHNERDLILDRDPELVPFAEVRVWGTEVGGKIHVDRLVPVEPRSLGAEKRTGALIGAPPLPPTRLVMTILDLGGGTNVTPEVLNQRLFTNADSIKAYYLENSFGTQDLVGMVMPTVYQHTMTTCDMAGIASKFHPMIEAATGQTFDIWLWYFGAQTDLCGFSGAANGRDTFYNGSSGCVVLVQEPGHSLGLSHSASLVCEGATIADDPNTCTHNEYGNRYDTMGGGCRHFNAYNKVYRSYLQKCNGAKVRTTGTFTLFPLEQPCNGIQVLQVPMPKTRPYMSSGGGGGDATTNLAYYLVELRAPIGFDRQMTPSVIITAAPDFRVTGAGQGSGQHTWLLDAALSNSSGTNGAAHALAAGQTFTDPAGGVSITTESVSATSAAIRVTIDTPMGATTCLDGSPLAAPGPATCGEGAGGATGTGTGGASGSGGAGGRGVTGGASGASGGRAGVGGATGGRGVVNSGGATGTSGGASGSTGGAPGSVGGRSGDPGTGGSGTTTGTAGTTGTGGTVNPTGSGGAPGADGGPGATDGVGGCGCRVVADAGSDGGSVLAALFALGVVLRRRARRST